MSREPIIVDGVDVSGCVCRAEEKCILKDDECCFFPNCDYKNWQRKEQECEFWKKELNKTHLLMLKRQDELVKEILKNDQLKVESDSLKSELMQIYCYLDADKETIDQLKTENEKLEKDKANLDLIIETLKAQFNQLKAENDELKTEFDKFEEQIKIQGNFIDSFLFATKNSEWLNKSILEDEADSIIEKVESDYVQLEEYKQALQEIKNLASCGKDMYMERDKYENYEAMAEWMKNQFYFILQKCEVLKDE